MRNPKSNRVPPAELGGAICELLISRPHTVIELASILNYSCNAVQIRLYELRSGGYAVRKSDERSNNSRHYVWYAGPNAQPKAPKQPRRPQNLGERPCQRTVKNWEPIHMRDWLVSAFFSSTAPGMHSPSVDSAASAGFDLAPSSENLSQEAA